MCRRTGQKSESVELRERMWCREEEEEEEEEVY
jgi:hypothetical protein